MNRGKLFGVGVGPGEKELVTLKAIRILKESDIIAVPKTVKGGRAAYDIVSDYIDTEKTIEYVMPMTKDRDELARNYRKIASDIENQLDSGMNVAFITLGDVTVYSTFMQVNEIVKADGYETELVPGITSFCAAAARLNMALCERDEPLIVVPTSYKLSDDLFERCGTKVFMKAGKDAAELCGRLKREGVFERTVAVENCGMENERLLSAAELEEITSNAPGYFTVFITK